MQLQACHWLISWVCIHLSTDRWLAQNRNEPPAPILDAKGSRLRLQMAGLDVWYLSDELSWLLGFDHHFHDLFLLDHVLCLCHLCWISPR